MKTCLRNFGIRFLLAGVLVAQLGFNAARAADTTPPTLASSAPLNGATAVALDSKIIFTFSEAMQTPTDYSTSLLWSDNNNAFDATKVSYSWSTDKTTLTCSYNGNLPSATTVSWTLLGGIMGVPGFGFSDLVGNGLAPMFVIGVFSTTGGGTNDCSGSPTTNANVTVFNLNKSAMYLQNSAGVPTPDNSTMDPFNFAAMVTLANGRTATSVTLALPGASPQPMDSFASFYFNFGSTNDLAKLNALYPAGDYTFAVTGTPNQTVTANLSATAIPNPPPHVSNYAAAQAINAGTAFTLSWDTFAGGLTTDSITVDVRDSSGSLVFQITNSAGCPSVLPGTATSVVLPANTLSSNQTYSAEITFVKNISFTTNASPPSVVIVVGYSITDVTIATFAGGVIPPPEMVLTNVVWLPTGQFQFQFPSAPGTSYTVEYTSDLGDPLGWNSLTPTNAVGNLIQITDTPPPGASPRIYRTRRN